MKKQTNIFDYFQTEQTRKRYGRTTHGGAKIKGHRKLERPLSTKRWIHLVLKSEKAKGDMSFLSVKNQNFIRELQSKKAKRFGIKVARFVNVGNHLHFKIRISSRENFQKFLKSLTTQIARYVTGARKGHPFGRFWQGLAYSRVLCSSRENLILDGYLAGNQEEANSGYFGREVFLDLFHSWIYKERVRSKKLQAYSSG